jgi:hypothetical protein
VARAIHRAALFGTLHEAVTAAGIEVVHSAQIVRAEIDRKDAAVITSDGHVLAFVRDWLAGPLSKLPVGRQVLVRLVSGMTVAPLSGASFAPLKLGGQEQGQD